MKGNLYQAKERVSVTTSSTMPDIRRAVALENYYNTPIEQIDWTLVDAILIGGETHGLPKNISPLYAATIPTINQFCLTVEASLAIALNEWRRWNTDGQRERSS
jgi:tRNA(Leu) C34 or U34 (ribose-2'-O)-methylase TrmL